MIKKAITISEENMKKRDFQEPLVGKYNNVAIFENSLVVLQKLNLQLFCDSPFIPTWFIDRALLIIYSREMNLNVIETYIYVHNF